MGRRRDLPIDAGTRLGAVILGLATALLISELPSPAAEQRALPPAEMERRAVEVEHEVRIYGAPPQIALSSWAIRRFQRAGLAVPHGEIHFYADLGACDGHLGYAAGGRIDVCTLDVDAMSRHAILHELAHIWLDANTSQLQRDRFLELRGLSAWNKTTDSWMWRGYEQAAELMAWVLGERIITPKIPNNDPALLAEAFELLTGIETSTAAELPYPEGSKGIVRAGVPREGLEDPVGEIPDVRETRQAEVHLGPQPTSSGSSTGGADPAGRGHEPTDHDAGWDSSRQGLGRYDPVSQHRRALARTETPAIPIATAASNPAQASEVQPQAPIVNQEIRRGLRQVIAGSSPIR
jgi:hypothetical protein